MVVYNLPCASVAAALQPRSASVAINVTKEIQEGDMNLVREIARLEAAAHLDKCESRTLL